MAGRLHTGKSLDKAHHCHNYRTDMALLSTSEILVLFNLPAWASLFLSLRKFLTVIVFSFSLHTPGGPGSCEVDSSWPHILAEAVGPWDALAPPGACYISHQLRGGASILTSRHCEDCRNNHVKTVNSMPVTV